MAYDAKFKEKLLVSTKKQTQITAVQDHSIRVAIHTMSFQVRTILRMYFRKRRRIR